MVPSKGSNNGSKSREKQSQPYLRPQKPDSQPHSQSNSQNIYGAIDLGTNNCRLLVAHKVGNGFKVIDSFSRIVRLGEGLNKNGTLSKDAVDRTIEALNICVAKMQRRGVTHMRNVATQACREAVNCDEFIERVEKEVRIKLHIIDPAEEARLAVLGCKALLDVKYSNAIVFDIGGGSTELIWVKIHRNGLPEIIDWTSVPHGVVNLSEKYGTMESISVTDYAQMKQNILDAVKPFEQKNHMQDLIRQGKVQLLGTSGTITTLTSMHLELDTYDRNRVDGTRVEAARIRALCEQLSLLNYNERVELKSIGADRADLVVAGCAILETIMDLWPIETICVADRGIREGLLLDMMQERKPKSPRRSRNRRRNKRSQRADDASKSGPKIRNGQPKQNDSRGQKSSNPSARAKPRTVKEPQP